MTELARGATIGIIGGGQLGRMLATAAARLGFRTLVLEPAAACPAAQVASGHIAAPYDDREALGRLAAECDAVTYEFENIDLEAARWLEAHAILRPGSLALETAQDRLVEKRFLNDCGIATAAFSDIPDEAALTRALETFGGKGILKTRRFGYDGKGQVRFSGAAGDPSPREAMAVIGGAPAILEEFAPFDAEISVIAARGATGQIVCYDAPRNVHEDGILATSTVPAGIVHDIEAAAADSAGRLAEALSYVGVLGLEFFVMPDGSLLANEFAPRVHNSGHWTEAACVVSQFEQHVRAIAGWPLGDGSRHSDCTMHNLIGRDIERTRNLAAQADVRINDYGKSETRTGRKMGHYTRLKSRSG